MKAAENCQFIEKEVAAATSFSVSEGTMGGSDVMLWKKMWTRPPFFHMQGVFEAGKRYFVVRLLLILKKCVHVPIFFSL